MCPAGRPHPACRDGEPDGELAAYDVTPQGKMGKWKGPLPPRADGESDPEPFTDPADVNARIALHLIHHPDELDGVKARCSAVG